MIDIDQIALEVARRFTQDTEPKRRASLQVAVIDAIKRARPSLSAQAVGDDTLQVAYEAYADVFDGMPGSHAAALRAAIEAVSTPPQPADGGDRVGGGGNHKLDTDTHVFFYEQDFYVLSNFSAFSLQWDGIRFDTSEAAYHYEKFKYDSPEICEEIRNAPSAHEAFKIAERNKHLRHADWDLLKIPVMRAILHAKADQHEYVRRKLLATGDRILVEDSWRDDYWGWGPNRDGQNMLGKLWMEVRAALAKFQPAGGEI